MDEDESERERCVTIDIATKYISTVRHELKIIDAPDHADFVPAMMKGAASADVRILVVAATPDEFQLGFDDIRSVTNHCCCEETRCSRTPMKSRSIH